MATFVMMSMVFTVVLLKSAALPTPLLPKAYTVVDWIVPKASGTPLFKAWADGMLFFVGDNLTFPNEDVERVTTKAAYEACTVTDNLVDQLTEANRELSTTLNSATEYYFISPNVDHCKRGLKLTVSVSNTPRPRTSPYQTSSPAASVGVLVPMMAVVMGFFF